MDDLPRLLAFCLVASSVAFGIWFMVLEPASGLWIFVIAIVVLALLAFVDGMLESLHAG